MKIMHFAGGAFLLNTLLFGSYYAISKEVLGRVDPIMFSFCEMMTLVPPALIILAWSWRQMTRQAVKSGFVLGSCLCLGLFMLSIALRYNSATGTAFFPALNGLLAALFTWLVLRKPIAKTTWFAGIVSVTGAFLLMANADMGGIRGSLIAFIGGLFCTMYIFLVDNEQKSQAAHWPVVAIQLLTMALWGNLIALLFGDWHMAHFELPQDALVILYIGLGTVCLPTFITVLLQKHISPVTVSFIFILEPILSAIVAYLYLHEVLPLDGYLGGALIVVGVLIHTWGSLEQPGHLLRQGLGLQERFHTSRAALLLYPLLCSAIGTYIVSRLGGFPPPVWRDLLQSIPQLPTIVQQGHAMDVCILLAQSLSWLIAWSALLLMGGIAIHHALENLFMVVGTKSARVGANPTPTVPHADWQYQKYVNNLQHLTPQQIEASLAPTLILPKVEASPTPKAQEATSSIPRVFYEQAQTQPELEQSLNPLQIDVRLLRQMGYTPYRREGATPLPPTRPTKRKRDPALLQQRRLQRRIRLAHEGEGLAPFPKVTEPLPDASPAIIEKQEIYSDTSGNAYFYWDEVSHVEVGPALFSLEETGPFPEGVNDETK